MEKAGWTTFFIQNEEGEEREFPTGSFLTPNQDKMMSTQPDLMVQTAKHIRQIWDDAYGERVKVRAEVWASLNGRRSQLMVDPFEDLASLENGWEPRTFVLPWTLSSAPVNSKPSKTHCVMHAVGKLACLVWVMWTVGVGELAGQTVVVQDETGRAMPVVMVQWSCLESEAVDVFTAGAEGFQWPDVFCQRAEVVFSAVGFETDTLELRRPSGASMTLEVSMRQLVVDLSEAEVGEEGGEPLTFMNALEAGGMYRGVKSAVLSPSSQLVVDGETKRAMCSPPSGANVWESDAAGLQLGIGVRGMSPNRSAHLSMRQNGHPIAADPWLS